MKVKKAKIELTKEELRVIYVALEELLGVIYDELPDDKYLGTGETFREVEDTATKLLTKVDMELDVLN